MLNLFNGMGPFEFARVYGLQQHNVYLQAFIVYGWTGGMAYIVLLLPRVGCLRTMLVRTPWQPYLITAFAAFVGEVLEGFIIDTDHWRHFFLLLGMIWGLAAATLNQAAQQPPHAAGGSHVGAAEPCRGNARASRPARCAGCGGRCRCARASRPDDITHDRAAARRRAAGGFPLGIAGLFSTASGIGEGARLAYAALDAAGFAPVAFDLSAAFGQTEFPIRAAPRADARRRQPDRAS